MRDPRLVFATIIAMLMAAPSPVIAQDKAPPNPAPASNCDPMPYTVEKADQLYGLQLTIMGLKPKVGEKAAPLVDGNLDYQQVRSRASGLVFQAMSEVAAIEFCRAAERSPALEASTKASLNEFLADLDAAFNDVDYADTAAVREFKAQILASCSAPKVCPQVMPNSAFRIGRKIDDFTSNVWTSTRGGLEALDRVKGSGCAEIVNRSAARANDASLVAFGDTGRIVGLFLAGGTDRVTARLQMVIHARAAFKIANANDVSSVASDPRVRSCMATVAAAVNPPADAQSATPPVPPVSPPPEAPGASSPPEASRPSSASGAADPTTKPTAAAPKL